MSREPLTLTSAANPRIKAAVELGAKAKARAESGLFVVEGPREIGRALSCGLAPVELFQCDELLSEAARALAESIGRAEGVARYRLPASVYARLAIRDGVGGLVAVFRQRLRGLADLRLAGVSLPLVLALQGVEKPGNVGALLRSADGAGATAVVLLDGALDLYNPNLIRASLGAAFSVPVAAATSAAFLAFCRANGLAIYAAALASGAVAHFRVDWRRPAALLLGEEATGLTPDWLAAADACIQIPMRGLADSLNVSAAGAVLLFEAVRQRAEPG